ncbi:hypothetical protein P3X46_009404 [Hevea brasiliensis]|uniref:VQ domain-containing protein n=1 Tax=Hevea brasiliensis TaxID=3981 RepID=A0ABQ9MM83_HEVBR|nr:protein MKS1-like [Hevea brasiliensis]KAJ9181256.1 hypothetical protein P3X46_009404 [Hevea brasiliensis]
MASSVRRQLQGPRPAPLMVSRNSSKIKKPWLPNRQRRSPVVIYLKSPDIIHVKPEEFMGLVQRLTGKQAQSSVSASSSSSTSCAVADTESMEKGPSSMAEQQELDSELAQFPSFFLNIFTDHWSEFQ